MSNTDRQPTDRTGAPRRRARNGHGFSLVELMVSVVVGMLALLFATRLIVGGEHTRQAALGGSDSMQNGMLAMFSISNDAAQAGYGLNDPIIVGCNTVFNDSEHFALAAADRGGATVYPLAAAVIESNGSAPDRITLYAGSSMSGTGTLRLTADYTGGSQLTVDRVPYGFHTNDVIVVAPDNAGGNCALAQISADPAVQPLLPLPQVITVGGGSDRRFNSGNLGANFSAGMARMFNLGPASSLAFHTWSVANGFLQLRSTDLAGSSANPATVVDNVVSIKAQYGFDTRLGAAFAPESGLVVSQWSSTMINADGVGLAGSAEDYQRISALRIAVVARSKAPERAAPGQPCTATTALPVVFGSAEPANAIAAPIAVNVTVSGDPVDWKCYRYRVFETIVPMRNSAWRPTA